MNVCIEIRDKLYSSILSPNIALSDSFTSSIKPDAVVRGKTEKGANKKRPVGRCLTLLNSPVFILVQGEGLLTENTTRPAIKAAIPFIMTKFNKCILMIIYSRHAILLLGTGIHLETTFKDRDRV